MAFSHFTPGGSEGQCMAAGRCEIFFFFRVKYNVNFFKVFLKVAAFKGRIDIIWRRGRPAGRPRPAPVRHAKPRPTAPPAAQPRRPPAPCGLRAGGPRADRTPGRHEASARQPPASRRPAAGRRVESSQCSAPRTLGGSARDGTDGHGSPVGDRPAARTHRDSA